jgi:hypothetical protein
MRRTGTSHAPFSLIMHLRRVHRAESTGYDHCEVTISARTGAFSLISDRSSAADNSETPLSVFHGAIARDSH